MSKRIVTFYRNGNADHRFQDADLEIVVCTLEAGCADSAVGYLGDGRYINIGHKRAA